MVLVLSRALIPALAVIFEVRRVVVSVRFVSYGQALNTLGLLVVFLGSVVPKKIKGFELLAFAADLPTH